MYKSSRIRTSNSCFALLPAGVVFGSLLFSAHASFSQTPSFSTHTFTSAVNNSLVLHGDLNNDGYEDLIMSTSSGSRVYLSKGNGSYTALPASISSSPQLLGDFNGDGKLDLIAGNHMYLGNGDGTFRSAGVISIPGDTISIDAADVNHDGKTDLLILTDNANLQADAGSIQVLFGNGDGTFRAGPETPNGDSDEFPCCLAVQFLTGDFNGDGNVDVVFATGWGAPTGYYGTIFRVFLGDGKGNFSLTFTDQDSDKLNLSAADVNGDGISDLVGTAVNFDNDARLPIRRQEFQCATRRVGTPPRLSTLPLGWPPPNPSGKSSFGRTVISSSSSLGVHFPITDSSMPRSPSPSAHTES